MPQIRKLILAVAMIGFWISGASAQVTTAPGQPKQEPIEVNPPPVPPVPPKGPTWKVVEQEAYRKLLESYRQGVEKERKISDPADGLSRYYKGIENYKDGIEEYRKQHRDSQPSLKRP